MKLDIDDSKYYYDDDLKYLDNYDVQINKKIYDWFNNCWLEATKESNITMRYWLTEHDRDKAFDLTQSKVDIKSKIHLMAIEVVKIFQIG